MSNYLLRKLNRAKYFALPSDTITKKGIVPVEDLRRGEYLLGLDDDGNEMVNRIESLEKVRAAGNYYCINDKLLLFENQSIYANGGVTHVKLLKIGDRLTGFGATLSVRSIRRVSGQHYFYKFEVGGNHSYFVNGILLHNASRYWVGVGATWNASDTSGWSASSGGASGASVPTSADNVFFDANSGNCAFKTLEDAGQSCSNLDCTGYTGTWSHTGAETHTVLHIYGSSTLAVGMTWSATKIRVQFNATATGKTITSNGINMGGAGSGISTVVFNGVGGGWTLQDAFVTLGDIVFTNGSFNAGNQNVTCRTFNSNNSNVRTITMGSGTWTLTTDGNNLTLLSTNLTFSANTSTIKYTGALLANITFNGGGLTFYNFWNATTGSFAIIIAGSNTFNDFKVDPGTTTKFTDGTTQTVTTFTAAAGAQRTLTGTSTAGWTISDSAGTNTVNNCTISYSTASGGAVWDADTANGNVDGGNNVGWDFGGITNPDNAFASDNVYAEIDAVSGVLTVELSKDAGSNWQNALSVTFGAAETTETFGDGSTELWGSSWTGDDVDDTSFRLRISHNGVVLRKYKTFGFAIGASNILTGIEVAAEGKYTVADAKIYLDHIKVKIYYGTSTLPVQAGSLAFASDGRKAGEGVGLGSGVQVFFDATNWIAVDTGATVAA